MRIVHTPVRFSSTGGVESYVRSLTAELAALGHSIKVIAADAPGKKPDIPGVTALYLRTAFSIANTNITPGLLPALLREDYDLLHTQLPTPWSADLSMIAGKLKDVPFVLSYQNDIAGAGINNAIAGLYNATALKLLLRAADRIIITRAEFLSPHLVAHKDRLSVIPPGIDPVKFHPEECEQIADIFFLSVLDEYHEYKGLRTLLAAVRLLKKDRPGILLIVGGNGPMKEYYQRMAKDLQIGENVIFSGYIPEEDLPDFYQQCRTFVLPSTDPVREGFGIVLLEAMACGRPVVTTEIAGVAKDIVAADAGIVVDRNSPEELAAALNTLLSSDERREQLAGNARRLVLEKYTWKRIAREIDRLYRALAGGR
jgi:glycosyltransferase involved in cell wall biosynthesis